MATIGAERMPPETRDDGSSIAASVSDPCRFVVVFDRHHDRIRTYLARAGRAVPRRRPGRRDVSDRVRSPPPVRPHATRRPALAVRDRREPPASSPARRAPRAPGGGRRRRPRRPRRELLDHISRRPRRSRHRRFSPRWPVAVAAAATAVVLVLTTGVGHEQVGAIDARAAQALDRAAHVAAERPARVLGTHEYFYVRSRTAYLTTTVESRNHNWSVVVPAEEERWTARDGSGRQRSAQAGAPELPSPADREEWRRAGRPPLRLRATDQRKRGVSRPFVIGSARSTYEEILALPRDPAALVAKFRRLAGDAGSTPEQETFTLIADLLRSAPVPSDLRAALFRALARIPGVRHLGIVRDAAGRTGVGVAVDDAQNHVRDELVFDPRTAAVLEERTVITTRTGSALHAPVGYADSRATTLATGVVGSVRARPAR